MVLYRRASPALSATAHAYRYAGFGTHEIVIYYDLVRLLLDEAYKRVREEKNVSTADEATRLEQVRSGWLEAPNRDHHGRTPAMLIEWERKRVPLLLSGSEVMVDEDCPICQEMAEDSSTPMFRHLDGRNMDEQFEFSFYKTREEWEAEQRRWERFNREFDREWREREALTPSGDGMSDQDPVQF